MSDPVITFIAESDQLLLKYRPSGSFDQDIVGNKLKTNGEATVRKVFTFIIEIKRPEPHQLLSRKPGSRGNYTPASALSEAAVQVEKYLFHLSKWGQAGERAIQEKHKDELPVGFEIRITNPKAMLILGRDKDFTSDQKFDFEIIKRKYANIVDIMTYDDLLLRLKNIIAMIGKNYSKLGAVSDSSTMVGQS